VLTISPNFGYCRICYSSLLQGGGGKFVPKKAGREKNARGETIARARARARVCVNWLTN
jgi:hypothetical protein